MRNANYTVMCEKAVRERFKFENKLGDQMINQVFNPVIAKYRDWSMVSCWVSCRWQINDFAADKLRYLAQPRPIIVNCLKCYVEHNIAPASNEVITLNIPCLILTLIFFHEEMSNLQKSVSFEALFSAQAPRTPKMSAVKNGKRLTRSLDRV